MRIKLLFDTGEPPRWWHTTDPQGWLLAPSLGCDMSPEDAFIMIMQYSRVWRSQGRTAVLED